SSQVLVERILKGELKPEQVTKMQGYELIMADFEEPKTVEDAANDVERTSIHAYYSRRIRAFTREMPFFSTPKTFTGFPTVFLKAYAGWIRFVALRMLFFRTLEV
ncbi:hypothetical protein CARUB_v100189941mg, partial [Capsella rubella]